ncbi:hypothetical protein BC826DRAFT_1040199 [Russula brevipes]|nr:hypothetical protein BC826DRAFT_1040199 [Russula brevipes]
MGWLSALSARRCPELNWPPPHHDVEANSADTHDVVTVVPAKVKGFIALDEWEVCPRPIRGLPTNNGRVKGSVYEDVKGVECCSFQRHFNSFNLNRHYCSITHYTPFPTSFVPHRTPDRLERPCHCPPRILSFAQSSLLLFPGPAYLPRFFKAS